MHASVGLVEIRIPSTKPEDVPQAIAFLADGNPSGFVDGVSLPVDGGWIADASWESLRTPTRIAD